MTNNDWEKPINVDLSAKSVLVDPSKSYFQIDPEIKEQLDRIEKKIDSLKQPKQE